MSKPTQYTKGFVEFYKLKFKVTPDVLIPRPETEILVEEIIKANPKTVLEIGTGSGNIAISIAKNLPDVKVTATDISEKAIEVARQNSKLHYLHDRVIFVITDLIEAILETPDLIVANLPYIPTDRIPHLDSSVKDYEPHIALDGGEDGFELYRKLFVQMKKKNIIPKVLIAEIDYTQAYIAVNEAKKYFPHSSVEIKNDLSHMQRFLVIQF